MGFLLEVSELTIAVSNVAWENPFSLPKSVRFCSSASGVPVKASLGIRC